MENKIIDARGLSCPQPVVCTMKALKSEEKNFTVLVDAEASKENVIRFLNKNGMTVEVEENSGEYSIKASGK